TETMVLKAELIGRHFEPKTIIEQSNIMNTAEAQNQQLIEQAIQLIKTPDKTGWRIKIEPESMAMLDYQSLKAERSAFLENLGRFVSASTSMAQVDPRITPFLMEMVKWGVAAFPGSNEIEGVLDRALEELKKPKPPEQESNDEVIKRQAQREKMAHEKEMVNLKAQAAMQEEQQK